MYATYVFNLGSLIIVVSLHALVCTYRLELNANSVPKNSLNKSSKHSANYKRWVMFFQSPDQTSACMHPSLSLSLLLLRCTYLAVQITENMGRAIFNFSTIYHFSFFLIITAIASVIPHDDKY